MKVSQNLATNISIPIVSALLATMASPNSSLIIAWAGISSVWLFLKAMDPRADEFMEDVDKNFGGITERLIKSTEFQQSLLVTFDTLIRTRNEEKRRIIKTVYLKGYISSKKRKKFELERYYQTSQNISLDAAEYLLFIKQEFMPQYFADLKKKMDNPNIVEGKLVGAESIGFFFRTWNNENYNVSNPRVVQKNPTLETDENLKTSFIKRKTQNEALFEEYAAEYLSLGIFRSTGSMMGGGLDYTFTSFGDSYLNYI